MYTKIKRDNTMIVNRLIGRIGFVSAAFLIVASLAGTAHAVAAMDAPEIDAGTINGALALLAGGSLLLSGRRFRKEKR
jgi:hypothetical protein